MKIIENLKVQEKVYVEKLENGLTVMIIPKKGIQKKYVIWGTNYGSNDSKFVIPGEERETEVPKGVAHFLEHKMFEQKNGINSLDTLTALGVEANAYTTNDHTAYLFECTENFYPALDELMDYVQNPYFTEENVEKEKGIIGQEIMMYDDYPEWRVYLNTLEAMYYEHPVKLDITGTIETISHIDKDILYKCYNTFYNPANMVMCFSGDFNAHEIIEEVKKRLIDKDNKTGEIKRNYPEEQTEIVEKEKIKKMEVSMPIFVIGIKDEKQITQKSDEDSIIKKHIAIEIILNMLIGKSSKLYKELYEKQLLISEPYLEYEWGPTYAHISITGQSVEPKKILEALQAEIRDLKKNGFDEENFKRIKNMIYGNYVKEYNDVGSIVRMFVSDYFKGINSFNYLENYSQVTAEYTKQILEEVFKEDKTVISIVEGK